MRRKVFPSKKIVIFPMLAFAISNQVIEIGIILYNKTLVLQWPNKRKFKQIGVVNVW